MKQTCLTALCFCALTFQVVAKDTKTASSPAPADNTALNQRDRSGDTKTSGDQSESAADVKTSAAIRRAVVGDKSLSMTAKNVKIITANGVVTLRGPVNTAAEKAQIAKLAQANAGKAKIENLLEIKAAK